MKVSILIPVSNEFRTFDRVLERKGAALSRPRAGGS
jgi:hypothetical protein